jgi:hypothetical protein
MSALVRLECVELVSERPVRGAVEHFYRATELHLIDTDEWEELDPMVGSRSRLRIHAAVSMTLSLPEKPASSGRTRISTPPGLR